MENKIRVVMAAAQPEFIKSVKNSLQYKPFVEMVITANKASEAEFKLNRNGLNLLLVDLESTTADLVRVQTFHTRFNLLVIYTACNGAQALNLIKAAAGPSGSRDDFVLKPIILSGIAVENYTAALCKKMDAFIKQQARPGTRDLGKLVPDISNKKIVAVASSTGGTNALEVLLSGLPTDMPPLVVVQHMPSGFTKLFADRLNAIYRQEVKEAETGDYLKQGCMLLAPADRHMRLIRQHGKLAVECFIGTKIHGVMPAADILFDSVAELVKENAIGVVLTGMGSDGAKGLLHMHNSGAKTIGQDKDSSVVYGMPKAARDLGAVNFELPLNKIAEKIISLV